MFYVQPPLRAFFLAGVLLAVLFLASDRTNPTFAADPPGVIIDRSPDPARVYIGSPTLAVLPDGSYVAAHDWFGPGTTFDTTAVLRSEDRGETWKQVATLDGQFWSNLFVHRENLYILGCGKRYGPMVIRRSDDGGRTWTTPTDSKTGVLRDDTEYHCAPMPVVAHGGRIWRTMEDNLAGGGWGYHFRALVCSAPEDADLLDASNWTATEPLASPDWVPRGWLEGNAVVTPDNRIVNILRVGQAGSEQAVILDVSPDGKKLSCDRDTALVPFPGGSNKFTIRYDPKSGMYWSLVNKEANPKAYRNVLTLTASKDLRNWEVRTIILRHYDSRNHAWQYPDWQFDGDDLIVASRTAWDGSHRAHDANFLTFHRIENFRDLTMDDAPDWLGTPPPPEVQLRDVTLGGLKHETDALRIEGTGVRLADFDNGKPSQANRTYTWQSIPDRFRGWKFTQTAGGERAMLSVTARRDGEIFITVAPDQPTIDTTGFTRIEDSEFHYTDGGRTKMAIFRREVQADETVIIPQGNWAGGLLLIPPR